MSGAYPFQKLLEDTLIVFERGMHSDSHNPGATNIQRSESSLGSAEFLPSNQLMAVTHRTA